MKQISAQILRSISIVQLSALAIVWLSIDANAQNYIISTTSSSIVITDVTGSAETITVSENGSNIRFTVTPSTSTYSIDGGTTTAFSTPADIALAGATSITINAAAGNDIITFNGFTANLPNLTINGGTGDDAVNLNGNITFATNANLDVDLQNDDPTPGIDNVSFAGGSDLILSGTGTATIKASKNIIMQNSNLLRTANGNLTIEANQQATPTTGYYFHGIDLTASIIEATGTGIVSIKGKGGNLTTGNHGIYLNSTSKISGGTTGTTLVQGTGGSYTGYCYGVYLNGTTSQITSSGANVSVTGTGGGSGTGSYNYGVYIFNTGIITATGSGTVTILGSGGSTASGNYNYGVYLAAGTITSSGGSVSVTGSGGGTGTSSNNYGVYVTSSPCIISAGGTGTVTVNGTGGTTATGHNNIGIIAGTGSQITSSGGNVTVTGTGGGSGVSANNHGVVPTGGGVITAGGSGTVTVNGIGGTSAGGTNNGVNVQTSGSTITSAGGNVNVTGTGGGSSTAANNYGVCVNNGGIISNGSSGTVTVIGNGGTTTGNSNHGVYLYNSTAQITSGGGNVSVTGTGGGSGASGNNYGVHVLNTAKITAGGTGTVTVNGTGSTVATGSSNHGVFIRNAATSITSSGGNVSVTGTGPANTGSAPAGSYGVVLNFTAVISAGGTGTVTVNGTGGANTAFGNTGIYCSNSSITSAGGNVIINGQGGNNGASSYGVQIVTAPASFSATGTGNLTINATGGTTNIDAALNASAGTITTENGDLTITATEPGSASALNLNGAITIESTGTGTVTLIANTMGIGVSAILKTTASGALTLRPQTAGVLIDLGGADMANTGLGLTDAELDRVLTPTPLINIGNASSGALTISAAITRPYATNLALFSAGSILPDYIVTDIDAAGGTLTLGTGSTLNIDIDGTIANTSYKQLNAAGLMNLNNAALAFTGSSHTPLATQTFTIVDNDGADAITGTFNGLAEGATISNFLGSGLSATISYIGGSGNDVVITVSGSLINTWTGASSTAWNNIGNWSSGTVPGTSDNASIPNVTNDPVISTTQLINDVDLASGATLSVASGGSLTLNGALTNAGTVTIQSGGSFLQGGSSSISGAGIFSVQRQGGNGQVFNYWSSPITSQTGIPGTSYTYNSSAGTQDDSDDQPSDPGWSSYNGAMIPGAGYAGMGGGLATFTGTPNNGTVNMSGLHHATFDGSYTSATGGTPFNLVGNPYPSAINANSFISANSDDIFGTIYFWIDDLSAGTGYSRTDYAYWNGTGGLGTSPGSQGAPSGNIASCQGFMVRVKDAAAAPYDISFDNTMRIAGSNSQFLRQNGEDSRLWFSIEGNDSFDHVLVAVLEDATEDEDDLYDAVKLHTQNSVSIAAMGNDLEHAIMAFPPTGSNTTVPVLVNVDFAGIYRFTANTMENFEGYEVYLDDMLGGTGYLLQEGASVPIALTAGEHANRFYLNFVRTTTGVDQPHKEELTAYAANDLLHISCADCKSDATIELIDMSGREVLHQQKPMFSNGIATIPMASISTGVYLVRVTTDGQTISRKIIKH
jgi:hypothetical protein